jgi:hypothetical protein
MKNTFKAGALIEEAPKASPILQRRAMMRHTNDITKLPTYEVLYRMYKRHNLGILYLTIGVTWFYIVWQKLGQ